MQKSCEGSYGKKIKQEIPLVFDIRAVGAPFLQTRRLLRTAADLVDRYGSLTQALLFHTPPTQDRQAPTIFAPLGTAIARKATGTTI